MASLSPYIASIDMWAPNFAPRGYAFCAGQILAISSNTALFSLIGTFYGGNGTSTFQLPDLRGRVPVGAGQGPGTSFYNLGEMGGTESTFVTLNNMPSHTHTATGNVTPIAGTGIKISRVNDPTEAYPAQLGGTQIGIYTQTNNARMGTSPVTVTVGNTGGSQPIVILQPYTAVNYIIATQGIFPSRN